MKKLFKTLFHAVMNYDLDKVLAVAVVCAYIAFLVVLVLNS